MEETPVMPVHEHKIRKRLASVGFDSTLVNYNHMDAFDKLHFEYFGAGTVRVHMDVRVLSEILDIYDSRVEDAYSALDER